MQARAHALLKGKDAELRDARAVAEQHFADSLREAEQALSAVHRELAEVRCPAVAGWQYKQHDVGTADPSGHSRSLVPVLFCRKGHA